MSKHTPGPWHVRTFDGSQWSIDAVGDLPIAQAQQLRPVRFDPKQNERTANARLIAAAPELLEALQDLLDTGFTGGPQGKRARAAIAKATGEAQ